LRATVGEIDGVKERGPRMPDRRAGKQAKSYIARAGVAATDCRPKILPKGVAARDSLAESPLHHALRARSPSPFRGGIRKGPPPCGSGPLRFQTERKLSRACP